MFALIAGLLFGAGLSISGMIQPENVIDFLVIKEGWNPSLIFVMGGALLVFIPGFHLIVKPRSKALNHDSIHLPTSTRVDSNLIIGAALFGIGWGLGGICPGPALVDLSQGSFGSIAFFCAMSFGFWLAIQYQRQRFFETNTVYSEEER